MSSVIQFVLRQAVARHFRFALRGVGFGVGEACSFFRRREIGFMRQLRGVPLRITRFTRFPISCRACKPVPHRGKFRAQGLGFRHAVRFFRRRRSPRVAVAQTERGL